MRIVNQSRHEAISITMMAQWVCNMYKEPIKHTYQFSSFRSCLRWQEMGLKSSSTINQQPACTFKLPPCRTGSRGLIQWHGLTLRPAWISNYIHYKVWDEIIYPFTNFNGATIEVWEWIRGPRCPFTNTSYLRLGPNWVQKFTSWGLLYQYSLSEVRTWISN